MQCSSGYANKKHKPSSMVFSEVSFECVCVVGVRVVLDNKQIIEIVNGLKSYNKIKKQTKET